MSPSRRRDGEGFAAAASLAASALLIVLVLAALLASACTPNARPGDAASPSASTASSASSAPPTDASGAKLGDLSGASLPSPRTTDPLWIKAKDEDVLERARLAEAVGAVGLLLGLEDGGDVAQTALASLPYADDADIALRRLGELALAADPRAAELLVATILDIAGRPPNDREPLDPEGARACGEALLTLAARTSLDITVRARAVSAARALASKGYVDPARIPAELAPPR